MTKETSPILFVFASGSLTGWLLELVYRGLYNRTTVPEFGFLYGPYLPIYGFGALIAFMLLYSKASWPVLAGIFIALVTALELATGLFFWRVFDLRLWDYSAFAFNYAGFISVAASLLWLILFLILAANKERIALFIDTARRPSMNKLLIVFYSVLAIDFGVTMVARILR